MNTNYTPFTLSTLKQRHHRLKGVSTQVRLFQTCFEYCFCLLHIEIFLADFTTFEYFKDKQYHPLTKVLDSYFM